MRLDGAASWKCLRIVSLTGTWSAWLMVVVVLGGCGAEPHAEVDTGPRVASADHHMHIQSAEAALNLDRAREAVEPPPEGETLDPSPTFGAADAIAALDAAGLEGGVLLSNAYMFAMPDVEVTDELAKVLAENDYVAEQAALFPERLVGLCSVNPLADYALDEIERCGQDSRLTGLKLHLANSDVDLRNDEHVEVLAEVFRRLGELRMPVLIHMRTRNPEYGPVDVNIFIERVLSQAPELPIQIAHMAGWGGYDAATDAALAAFVEAFDQGTLARERFSFGLGAVVFQPEAADNDQRAERVRQSNQNLASRLRELGLDLVVYATDWPAWPPGSEPRTAIERNLELIRSALPLSEEELERVLANVGVLFDGR